MRMQLCLYISWHFCNENNKLTWDESHPEKHTPPQWDVTRESEENATDHWAAEVCPMWKRKAGQSEARQYTPLAKLAKDVYNSRLTWKLHHLPPEKKSLYNPSMVWIELRGQKGILPWGQTGCDHLDFLSYAGHQQNGRHTEAQLQFSWWSWRQTKGGRGKTPVW